MQRYVIYTRVSTNEQGKSGLGLEAQKRDIEIFLEQYSDVPYEVIGEFQDIMSGANGNRPELAKALELARRTGAELLVAKLDRLSRKVSFIANLIEDKRVKLRVASMPTADNFQLHIYAALAEQERDFISKRTIAALKAAKERGTKLGGLRDATMKRNEAIAARADADAARLVRIIGPMRDSGKTLKQIAESLSETNIPTARGGAWTPMQVKRVLERGV